MYLQNQIKITMQAPIFFQTLRIANVLFSLFLLSCTNLKTSFECDEYWTLKNIKWEEAYDGVKVCQELLILRSSNAKWGLIYPGTITLINDTLHVNQENGIDNSCVDIGYVNRGERISVEDGNNTNQFVFQSDSVVEYAGKQYEKSKRPVMYGCWCKWREK